MSSSESRKHSARPASQADQHATRAEWPVVLLLMAIAFAIRLFRLGTVNLRSDEVLELLKAEHLYDVLFHGMLLDTHAPFFPLVTKLWSLLGLTSNDWLLRLLPALLGVACIPVMYALTRSLYDRGSARIAALLLAISPFYVTLSRELKDDVFLLFVGMLTAYWLVRAVQHNRPAYWAAYAATAVLACYSQFFMGPLLVMLNLWFMFSVRSHRDRFRGWFISNTVAFLLVIPVLLFALNRSQALLMDSDRWWVPKPTPLALAFYFKTLAYGYADLEPYFKIALALYGATAIAGFYLAWRTNRKWALLLAFWMPVTLACIILISIKGQSVFLFRSMALYGIPYYIWIGVAVARIRPAAARAAVLAAMLFLAATSLTQLYESRYSLTEFPHRPGQHPPLPFRDVANFIRERSLPGDLVAHTANLAIFTTHHYGLKDVQHANVGVDPGPIDNFRRGNPPIPMPEEFKYGFMTELQPLLRDRDRVWLIFTEWERIFMPNNPMSVYRWMDAHFTETLHQSFGDLEVFLFERARDGKPITVRSRDRDDGVSAQLEYEGGIGTRYTKIRPDAGLVALPPENRRGNLTLYFDDNPCGPVEGQPNATANGITFSIDNRSDRASECSLEVVFSDYLLEFASLNEETPAAGTWIVGDMYNPQPPPPSYAFPVAASHLTASAPAILSGELSLPPGQYNTQVRLLGPPAGPSKDRSVLSLEVGGADLLAPLRIHRDVPFGWTWFAADPMIAPAESILVTLRAELPAGSRESWNDAAYAAFLSAAAPSSAIRPTKVTLEPHAKRTWRYAGRGKRVDVWVYESDADGKAYRIFRTLQP